jgi:HD-like signal output (HDOD) protein
MIDLDALAQAASCLDPLPTSVSRLAAMMCAETPDLLEVVDVVHYDQALTATLLRTANSSWSASRTQITTVKDAVVRLGSSTVFSLALGVGVRGRLGDAIPEYGLTEGELWNHSVAASLAAELIVSATPRPLSPDTITAALLHDVGKLVMSRFLSPDVLTLLGRSVAEGGHNRMQSESEILGVHHAELGGLILQCWGLPESLVRAVSYHHAPDLGVDLTAYGVHLADVVAKVVGAGPDDNPDVDSFAHAMEELALDADDLDRICATTAERLEEVIARFGG